MSGALVLSRRELESIKIGDDVLITVVRIKAETVRLAIVAPKDVVVVRTELLEHSDQAAASDRRGRVNEGKGGD